MNILKSIGAVFTGLLVVVILSIGTDMLMRALGIFPASEGPMNNTLLAIATIYRTAYGIAGGYVTAKLAPNHAMQHALILGIIGCVLCILGLMAAWGHESEFGPLWYPFALVVLAVPQCWLGGLLAQRHSRS